RVPERVAGTELATTLLGDAIGANLIMLGYAWQKGWVPVSLDALMRAVELNGAAIEMNKKAFAWGRMAAHDPAAVRSAASRDASTVSGDVVAMPLDDLRLSRDPGEMILRRVKLLTGYQNAKYAERYRALVERVHA